MAKKFGGAAGVKKIQEVAAKSAERAQVVTVKMIPDSKLRDYDKNQEDISDTADLENSIAELGFTDPIEVTAFGMPEGEYMIVSGHRRRAAGRNCGINLFPCIVKSFNDAMEIQNYVLLANCYRDSSKDPLLYCKRYLLHENYLRETKFEGNVRGAVAERLGLSVSQADRYAAFNKIIPPVWELVKDGAVGMSSVLPMAPYTEDEQKEIYKRIKELLSDGVTLTRGKCESLIAIYRDKKNGQDEALDEKPDEAVLDSAKENIGGGANNISDERYDDDNGGVPADETESGGADETGAENGTDGGGEADFGDTIIDFDGGGGEADNNADDEAESDTVVFFNETESGGEAITGETRTESFKDSGLPLHSFIGENLKSKNKNFKGGGNSFNNPRGKKNYDDVFANGDKNYSDDARNYFDGGNKIIETNIETGSGEIFSAGENSVNINSDGDSIPDDEKNLCDENFSDNAGNFSNNENSADENFLNENEPGGINNETETFFSDKEKNNIEIKRLKDFSEWLETSHYITDNYLFVSNEISETEAGQIYKYGLQIIINLAVQMMALAKKFENHDVTNRLRDEISKLLSELLFENQDETPM